MRAALSVLALWAAGLGAAAQFGKMSVLYEQLNVLYAAHSGVGIGLLVSVVGLIGLIFGTTAGLLVARVGPRRAIIAALVLGALVSLIQSALPSYPLMMATRVLEGISHLAIVVVGPTAIASIAPLRLQGLAMTLWSSFFGVTYAVLAIFAPTFVAEHGAASLFQVHGGWMLAAALAIGMLMPADREVAEAGGQGGLIARHLVIYASPRIGAPALGFVCYTVIYVALLTLLPAEVTPGWGQTVAIGMPLISIAVSLTLGVWLLSRITAVRLVQYGFAAAILSAACLWLGWGHGATETAGALGLAASLGIVQGASFASIPQLNPSTQSRAAAAGAIAQLGNLGTTIGTPVLAIILMATGPLGLAIFVLVFAALGIALHSLQARRRN